MLATPPRPGPEGVAGKSTSNALEEPQTRFASCSFSERWTARRVSWIDVRSWAVPLRGPPAREASQPPPSPWAPARARRHARASADMVLVLRELQTAESRVLQAQSPDILTNFDSAFPTRKFVTFRAFAASIGLLYWRRLVPLRFDFDSEGLTQSGAILFFPLSFC